LKQFATYGELQEAVEAAGFFLGYVACPDLDEIGISVVGRRPDLTQQPAVRVIFFNPELLESQPGFQMHGDILTNIVVGLYDLDPKYYGEKTRDTKLPRPVTLEELNIVIGQVRKIL